MTVEAVLERAQSVGVYLHLDDGQVRLSGDKSAIATLLPDLRNHRAELVQLLSKKAEDQMQKGPNLAPATPPDWTPSPLLPDPGLSRLLALADRYCTAIQASDKARNDWRTDIEQTPPGLRGDLQRYLQGQLPTQASAPARSPVQAPAPKPLPEFSVHQPWNAKDKAYQAHHWNCPTCKVAARSGGHSQRCTEGQHLYATYEQAAMATKEST